MPVPKVGNKERCRRLDGAWRKKRSDIGKKRNLKIRKDKNMTLEDEILEYKDREIFIDLESWNLKDENVNEVEKIFNNKKNLIELKKFLQNMDKDKLIDCILFLTVMSINLRESQRKNHYLLEPLLAGYR